MRLVSGKKRTKIDEKSLRQENPNNLLVSGDDDPATVSEAEAIEVAEVFFLDTGRR